MPRQPKKMHSSSTTKTITLSEVLVNDRKKLGMHSADPQNQSEWRVRLPGRLVKQAQPSVEVNRALNGYDY